MTGIFPPDIGGPATSVPRMAASLAERGHRVAVVTLADDPVPRPDDPCEVRRVGRGVRGPRRVAAVVSAVRASRPDVVLANGLHIESAALPRTPVVQKIVGDWAWERAQNAGLTDVAIDDFQEASLAPRLAALRRLRSLVTRRARRVIVPSNYLAGLVATWGVPRERIVMVPNAAPPVAAAAGERDGLLYIGRLVRWKGVGHLLEALAGEPGVTLTIAGDGPERAALEGQAAALGLDGRVRFLGAVVPSEVDRLLGAAAALVLPSSYEGMPHVVLEAFAAGTPVAAAASGGTPELVDDGVSGALFGYGDVAGLRSALRRVLDPGEAARLVAGGAEVSRALTWQRTVEETERVLLSSR